MIRTLQISPDPHNYHNIFVHGPHDQYMLVKACMDRKNDIDLYWSQAYVLRHHDQDVAYIYFASLGNEGFVSFNNDPYLELLMQKLLRWIGRRNRPCSDCPKVHDEKIYMSTKLTNTLHEFKFTSRSVDGTLEKKVYRWSQTGELRRFDKASYKQGELIARIVDVHGKYDYSLQMSIDVLPEVVLCTSIVFMDGQS